MDPAIVPLLLVAFGVAMISTWHELRASLQPSTCSECPHCQDRLAEQRHAAREQARQQAEVRAWYARRSGFEKRDEDDRH